MTLRDFLILYPDAMVDMMTPGGYVRLNPQQIKRVLEGNCVIGNPGTHGHDMVTTSDDLLSQSIHECTWGEDGIYRLTTGHEPVEAPSYFSEKYGSAMMDGIAKQRLDENLASYRESLMCLSVPELIKPEKIREIATFYDLYDTFKDMPQCDVVMEYIEPLSLMTSLMRHDPNELVMSQQAFDDMWIPLCEDHGITDDEGYAKDPRFYDFEMRCMLPSQIQEQASRRPRTSLQVLCDKLDAGHKAFMESMIEKGPQSVFDNAIEIHAERQINDYLRSGDFPDETMDYLLRFKNPLQVVLDKWVFRSDLALTDCMDEALCSVMDDEDTRLHYELDPMYLPADPNANQQMG